MFKKKNCDRYLDGGKLDLEKIDCEEMEKVVNEKNRQIIKEVRADRLTNMKVIAKSILGSVVIVSIGVGIFFAWSNREKFVGFIGDKVSGLVGDKLDVFNGDKNLPGKKKDFEDLIIDKLHARDYKMSVIDASQWEKATVDKYGFSFRHPAYVKITVAEKDFDKKSKQIICIDENEYDESEVCDIKFVLFDKNMIESFFGSLIKDAFDFELRATDGDKTPFQIFRLNGNVLLYREKTGQECYFYNSKNNLVGIVTDAQFFKEKENRNVVKGIIQSLRFD